MSSTSTTLATRRTVLAAIAAAVAAPAIGLLASRDRAAAQDVTIVTPVPNTAPVGTITTSAAPTPDAAAAAEVTADDILSGKVFCESVMVGGLSVSATGCEGIGSWTGQMESGSTLRIGEGVLDDVYAMMPMEPWWMVGAIDTGAERLGQTRIALREMHRERVKARRRKRRKDKKNGKNKK